MFFLIKDDQLLEKYNKIELYSKPVYNKQYFNNTVKFYEGKIDIDFHGKKYPKMVLSTFV